MLAETVAEWKEEWKREGLSEGRKEGESRILIKLLELKFGSIGDEDRLKVQAADSETLLQWTERILSAGSLDDIFRP